MVERGPAGPPFFVSILGPVRVWERPFRGSGYIGLDIVEACPFRICSSAFFLSNPGRDTTWRG